MSRQTQPRNARKRLVAFVAALVVLTAACGGGGDTNPAATGPVVGIAPTPTAAPFAAGSELPEELAFSDKDVVVDGPVTITAAPGEALTLDYIILNPTAVPARYALRASASEGAGVPKPSSETKKIESRDVAAITVTYNVPLSAEAGDSVDVELLVANASKVSMRDTIVTTINIVDLEGERPVAGQDRATTTANEKVTAYVIGNDTDADGNIDYKSVRMVTGGFRALSASVDSNGTVTYVPFANVTGRDKLLYEICDTDNRCSTGIVTIDIEEA